MAFRKPHPRQRRTCEKYKAELEEENYHLRSELQTEVDTNHQNERRINQLEAISSRKNTPEQRNSPDLYNPNINLEMATITELANTIDGFLDNTADRDLVRKQRRRYDAEAEHNNKIIRRQNAEGVE
ncbi:unnamed protein product [Rhizophagus irregularis]|nr:unnamed protein product [Rhizophagus irregularis]